jgi:hypothetical protein
LIILDENILEGQRLLLEASRIAVRQIGVDIGHKGLKDEVRLFPPGPLLLQKSHPHTILIRERRSLLRSGVSACAALSLRQLRAERQAGIQSQTRAIPGLRA